MKYVILLGDGMADLPHEAFGGRTVLEAADIPTMDALARRGELGLVNTVTEGFPPGSDVTNLAILGVDPRLYYTGRAPIEAASMGIRLSHEELAFRCNLVTLTQTESGPAMDDYSAGQIKTESARRLIELLDRTFQNDGIRFHTGNSYRHLCVLTGVDPTVFTMPPHDIAGRAVADYLPKGEGAGRLFDIMERSRALFSDFPPNRRLDPPVTQVWLWGQGKAPTIPSFTRRCGLSGAVVSAVDLIQGIGALTGMKILKVPGATGYLDTNYQGKVQAAVDFLELGGDFVFLHIEAPDECGHSGIPENKKKAVEDFDRFVVAPMFEYLSKLPEFRLLVLPDHYTPLSTRAHLGEPVPYVLVTEKNQADARRAGYSENFARETGLFIKSGLELFRRFTSQ